MQIKLSYAEAQQHIIDVAHAMIPGEDVTVTLADGWTTTPPTAPGHYWTYAPGAPVYLMELNLKYGWLTETISGLTLEDLPMITHWLGPLPVPEPPVDDLDDTGLPPGAIEMTEPDNADSD